MTRLAGDITGRLRRLLAVILAGVAVLPALAVESVDAVMSEPVAPESTTAVTTEAPDANDPVDPNSPDLPADPNSPADGIGQDKKEALPQARSVNLAEPVPEIETGLVYPQDAVDTDPPAERAQASDNPPLVLLGTEVPPVTSTRLSWSPAQYFEGLASPTPVLVVHGAEPGPVLCLTAAIHGDELNGVEIVRRVLYNIDPEELTGSVVGVPIVNLQGFQRSSRYLPDRRDLNRYFPGRVDGSSAARIAHSFFHEIIENCTALVDLHTGSFDRTNLPQLRANLTYPSVVELARGFGATVVLHNEGALGTLRRAAVEIGIPAVTVEAGGPMRLQEDAIKHSVKGIETLLGHLGMQKSSRIWGKREPVYYSATWVRAALGGMLRSEVKLGAVVDKDEVLGTVTNPITNVSTEIRSPIDGRVVGMALDQVVFPGYAAYHIGISADAGSIFAGEESIDDELYKSESSPTQEVEETVGVDLQTPAESNAAGTESRLVDEVLESD